jgi:uncharacterized membrane protein
MINSFYNLKDMCFSAELFLSLSIFQLTIFALVTSYSRKTGFVVLTKQIYYIAGLILSLTTLLVLNENVTLNTLSNNSLVNDYLAFVSKIIICVTAVLYILIIKVSHKSDPKQHNIEYVILILTAILGLLILCSAADLITAYLAIELQSISFYLLATFRKNSGYSIESGLKYFIIGSLSSAIFLFGSSFVYGCLGSVNLNDFKMFIPLLVTPHCCKPEFESEYLKDLDFLIAWGIMSNEINLYFEYLKNPVLGVLLGIGSAYHYCAAGMLVPDVSQIPDMFDEPLNPIKEGKVIILNSRVLEVLSLQENNLLDWCLENQHEDSKFFLEFFPMMSKSSIEDPYLISNLLYILSEPNYLEVVRNKYEVYSYKTVLNDTEFFSQFDNPNFFNYAKLNLSFQYYIDQRLIRCPKYFDLVNNATLSYLFYCGLHIWYSETIGLNIIKNLLEFSSENFSYSEKVFFVSKIINQFEFDGSRVFIEDFFSSILIPLITIGFFLIVVSLFIKLAVAPFHLWSLDVYEGSPNVSTFFFLIFTKLALFVFLIRICYSSFYFIFIEYKEYFFFVFVVKYICWSLWWIGTKKSKNINGV